MIDAQTLRRALHDFFKFNPKDFLVKGSGTGFLVSALRRVSSATTINKYGFRWFPAEHLDTPNPLAIQFDEGVINGSIVPDNMGSTFILPDNKTSYFIGTANVDTAAVVTSVDLSITETLFPDPTGSIGVPPATTSRPLWVFITEDGKIKSSIALRVGGIDITPVVVGMDCNQVEMRMFWGPAQNVVVIPDPGP